MKRLLFILSISVLFLLSCDRQKKHTRQTDWSVYRKAYNCLPNHTDSAFYYFNHVAANSRDSLPVAMAYNNMAMIQSDAGDYFGAQESLLSSLKFLDTSNKANHVQIANDYNELGMNSANLKNHDEAISFYRKALSYHTDSTLALTILNNIANAYQEQKKYPAALYLYHKLLNKTKLSDAGYARRLTNLSTTRWLADPHYKAAPELLKALRIRQAAGDLWGLNSSYAHLADYYQQVKPDSSFFFASLMLAVAQRLGSPDDQIQALQKLTQLSPSRKAKNYFMRYTKLNDSLQTARNASKNQFALIRYQVEKNKSDNLRLQKENTEKKYQLVIRDALLLSGFILLIIMIVSGRVWYRKWQKRKEQEKQEAVMETRRKASKDVHDSLSNDIYLLMKKIKHDHVLDRSWLLKHTEFVYKRSRNISYEMLADSDEVFPARIGELLKSFGTDKSKVSLVGNDHTLWQRVGAHAKLELKFILQELMVNMQKHSQAANVVVKFETKGNTCFIVYIDDGIGIPAGTVHLNGLTNTETRINAIGGRIIFGSNEGKGLRIDISFPLA